MMRILISLLLMCFLSSAVFADSFILKSNGLNKRGHFPVRFTCSGQNHSPPLLWENAPANTKAFALIFYSPDAATGTTYFWVLYNIPGNVSTLSENQDSLPDGTQIGLNSQGEANYRGPCPPDDSAHKYIFMLYALKAPLDLPSSAEISDVLNAIKRQAINQTQLNIIYGN